MLGYCLLHWLCGKLPWDSVLKRPLVVQEAKAKYDRMPSFCDSYPSRPCVRVPCGLASARTLQNPRGRFVKEIGMRCNVRINVVGTQLKKVHLVQQLEISTSC